MGITLEERSTQVARGKLEGKQPSCWQCKFFLRAQGKPWCQKRRKDPTPHLSSYLTRCDLLEVGLNEFDSADS